MSDEVTTPTTAPAPAPRARPGMLQRTFRARMAVILAVGAALIGWSVADRLGLLARFAQVRGALDGKLVLEHGVTVERVRLNAPPCQLIVARIPRRSGLRLQAARLTEVVAGQRAAPPGLAALSAVARLGAIVAVNGDYHRLDGHCDGLPFSTLVTGREGEGDQAGRPAELADFRAIGSPFDYACAFHVAPDGAPSISSLDLGASVRTASGRTIPALVDLAWGDALLCATPPPGRWSPPTCAPHALPLRATGPGEWSVNGPWRRGAMPGPALLLANVDDATKADTRPGAGLTLQLGGRDAGRIALAIGTGPRLVEAGEVPVKLEAAPGDPTGWVVRVARTAVALTDDHLLLVTTLQAPRQGLSYGDLARALKALGAKEALALDGGPSTGLWAQGRYQNMDDPYEPNDVATALVVLPPGSEGVELR